MKSRMRFTTCTFVLAITYSTFTWAGEIEIIDGVPDGYEVVRVTNEPINSSVPEINNRSEVVWGTRDGDVYKVHRFANGIMETLSDGTNVDYFPTNNDASELAWIHCPFLFTGPCTVTASYSPEAINGDLTPKGRPSMNVGGDIVWAYEFPTDPDHQEIVLFRRDSGIAEIVTNVGLNNQTPRVNDSRQIIWTQFNFDVAPWQGTIMLWSDGETQAISSGTTQAQGPDLNGQGIVVWRDPPDILMWDGTNITNLTAEVPGNKITPRINNSGDLYFGLSDQGTWVAIIVTDGTWYRLPDFGLESSQGSLNDRGELAWRGGIDPGSNSNILLLRRVAPKGDFNHDCHIDMVDARVMQICFTGADNSPPEGLLAQCTRADFDEDGDVDAEDVCAFIDVTSGPNVMVPDCEP